MTDWTQQTETARTWFETLRDRICAEFEAIEREAGSDASFHYTPWNREEEGNDNPGGGVQGLMKGAVFEMSEAKRWLLGGYNHGFVAGLPHPIATEMALGFRFTAERLYEVGFLNRLVDPDDLMPTAMEMAEHLLTLPPAARVNTIYMMRQMIPEVAPPFERLAAALHEHGCKEDRMESRRAFAEKRKPRFRGWDDPEDRHRMPTLESISKAE